MRITKIIMVFFLIKRTDFIRKEVFSATYFLDKNYWIYHKILRTKYFKD